MSRSVHRPIEVGCEWEEDNLTETYSLYPAYLPVPYVASFVSSSLDERSSLLNVITSGSAKQRMSPEPLDITHLNMEEEKTIPSPPRSDRPPVSNSKFLSPSFSRRNKPTLNTCNLFLVFFALFIFLFLSVILLWQLIKFQKEEKQPIYTLSTGFFPPNDRANSFSSGIINSAKPSRKVLPDIRSAHESDCNLRYSFLHQHSNLTSSLSMPSLSYFIAVNLHNNADILAEFLTELTRTLQLLCIPSDTSLCSNIYLSIYESGSKDTTATQLDLFSYFLFSSQIPHTIITHGEHVKKHGEYRIDHLVLVRNAVIAPLYNQAKGNIHYDRIIFLNDILFCAEDILLLVLQSRRDVQIVCGLDYDSPIPGSDTALFYDTWVMRGIDGGPVSKSFPYFTETASTSVQHMKEMKPFKVFCCWNGVTILNSKDWYEFQLKFRSRDDLLSKDQCFASECSHICEDYWAIHGEKTKIVIEPLVQVAYERRVYEMIPRMEWWNRNGGREKVWQQRKEKQDLFGRSNGKQEVINNTSPIIEFESISWHCCDLNLNCRWHEVKKWSDQEKEIKRKLALAVL